MADDKKPRGGKTGVGAITPEFNYHFPNTEFAVEPESDMPTFFSDFFRVLMAFISGVANQDFAEFDLLSEAYFPPGDPPPPPPEETPEQKAARERQELQAKQVNEMRAASKNPAHEVRQLPEKKIVQRYADGISMAETLPKELLQRIKSDPQVAAFVEKTKQEVREFNTEVENYNRQNPGKEPRIPLNETWVIRQFNQESRFKPGVVSSAGCIGIAQMKPSTAAQFGLSKDDMYDGNKCIEAGVKLMGNLTNKYGNQIFAMFVYSGGEGALNYAAKSLSINVRDMSIQQLAKFYDGERQELDRKLAKGEITKEFYNSRWAVESFDYAFKHVAPNSLQGKTLIAGAPVDTNKFRLSDDYGIRDKHPTKKHSGPCMHHGTDIATPIGTALSAMGPAVVAHTGTFGGYANSVILSYGKGIYTLDAHLSSDTVSPGNILAKGQTYAYSGNTGVGTAAHLHHEIWIQRGNAFYTVDAQKAWDKDLFDPKVQDALIEDAKKVAKNFSAEATVSSAIPAHIREAGAALTERQTTATLVAGNNPTAPRPNAG